MASKTTVSSVLGPRRRTAATGPATGVTRSSTGRSRSARHSTIDGSGSVARIDPWPGHLDVSGIDRLRRCGLHARAVGERRAAPDRRPR